MNKQQLLQQAKRIVESRRSTAEEKCDRLLATLRNNVEYAEIERNLRQAEIDSVMRDGKEQKQATAKIKEYKTKQKQFLSTLNLSPYDLKPHYSCTKCNDTGYVNNSMCSCLQAEIRKLIIAESNVTNGNYTFENSTETNKHNLAVYKLAQNACYDDKTNILLTGNTGSGKTYLLTACANLCAKLDKSVLFVTAYTLNDMFLNAYLSDYSTNHAIFESLLDVDVLVIDDLGTEKIYQKVTAESLFSVLNERIARKKQTFISTNLRLDMSKEMKDKLKAESIVIDTVRDRYDERIYSRLVDGNLTLVAELIGNDKRIKNA